MNNHAEAVLFDLDGTLIDTAPDFIITLNKMLAEQQRDSVEPEQIRKQVSAGARAMVRMAFDLSEDSPEVEPLRERFLEIYASNIADESRLFQGLDQLLDKMDLAKIPWGIVTNKPTGLSEKLLQALELRERCRSLICPEHVKERKPAPESLFLACEELQCDPKRTIYVGDHERDILAGHNAGMVTIGALYGYIPDDDNPDDWRAHFYTDDSTQLEALLNEQLNNKLL